MTLEVHQFACLTDNYGFLVRDVSTGKVACIDTPDADAILNEARALGWGIDFVFNTHWHPDHAGGNAAIKSATGAFIVGPAEVTRVSSVDRVVGGGDSVPLGNHSFSVLDCGGHTLGHISLYEPSAGIVFVGDTLFPMGCGRLFEGTAEQMWRTLSGLAALPTETQVFCAHEYTLANARFALSIDSDGAVVQRVQEVERLRSAGLPTVPTTIGRERETNPFLRAPHLMPELGGTDPAAAFAKIRQAKDEFKG